MSLPVSHRDVRYRPDIDGLRAVAVLLVIAYHMGRGVHGGYVGVDVFFVISGYLISAVVMADFAAGRFSILGFYDRRIRRIFPAMLVMMAATTVFAWHYFIPSELAAYGRSQIAALFSVSNILFWKQAGYFDGPSILKPLLHTWSLGVEEQFYIVFPLLIVLVRRLLPRQMKPVLCGLALISLAGAQIELGHDPSAAFYLAPLRAWELLLGTILSQGYLPSIRGAVARNMAGAAGLLAILYAGHYFTERTPFPGVRALLPCLGAALIIAAGETGKSLAGAILGWRPVVFVGLISYSLYLWHWPLLVFQRTGNLLVTQLGLVADQQLTAKTDVVFLCALFVVATLSWALVEQPFRKGRFRPSRRRLWQISGWSVAAMLAASLALSLSGGAPNRFPRDAQKIAAYTDYDFATGTPGTRNGTCFVQTVIGFKDFRPDICLAQHPGKRSILIAGDSHAAAVYPGLVAVFPDRDILQANVASCRALAVEPKDAGQACRDVNQFLFHDWLMSHHLDLLLLAGVWRPDDVGPLGETLALMESRGIPVILLGPPIRYSLGMPRLVAIAMRSGHLEEVEQHRIVEVQRDDALFAKLARERWHVPYISEYEDLCTPECPLYAAPGVPLMFDTHHLTVEGATLFARTMIAKGQLP